MSKTGSCLPANLRIAIPLKERKESYLGRLQDPLATVACYIPLAIEAVGDCMASEQQVDQVLTAVSVRCYEAGLRFIHVLPGLPVDTCQHLQGDVPSGHQGWGCQVLGG